MSIKVGILAQGTAQLYSLQTVIKAQGYFLAYSGEFSLRGARISGKPEVDVWIIALDGARLVFDTHPFVDTKRQRVIILDSPVPSLASANYNAWRRNLVDRLRQAVSEHQRANRVAPAETVWVLAASTGGLEAVGKFLSLVPAMDDVGFVYAQHIDQSHLPQLLRMISRLSDWPAELAQNGGRILGKRVTVVSPTTKMHVESSRELRILDQPWSGQYKPSIDHVAGTVSRQYGADCGMIVFTGIGHDGLIGSRLVRHAGGEVWVQTPESCAARSMPETIIGAQAIDFMGTVESMAQRFNETLREQQQEIAV